MPNGWGGLAIWLPLAARNLKERDFTSGVYASAVSSGDLTSSDLWGGDPAKIEAAILAGDTKASSCVAGRNTAASFCRVGLRFGLSMSVRSSRDWSV